jgi:predicted nucleic acid-binding protein
MTDQVAAPPGEGGMVVADAGPLIHLDELGCLGLLADFSVVRVPDAVWREVEHHRPTALRNAEVHWLRCIPKHFETVDALGALHTLHAGEREALHLCVEFPDSVLLTDDTAARLAAKTLDIKAHGTLGLLVRATRRKQLSKAEVLELLGRIPTDSSLHIRPGLLAEIIRQVAESAEPQ